MSVWTDMCRPIPEREAQQLIRQIISDCLSGRAPDRPCACGATANSHPAYGPVPDQLDPYVIYGFFAHDGTCLYVGQTQNLENRVAIHRSNYELFAFHADEVRILDGC